MVYLSIFNQCSTLFPPENNEKPQAFRCYRGGIEVENCLKMGLKTTHDTEEKRGLFIHNTLIMIPKVFSINLIAVAKKNDYHKLRYSYITKLHYALHYQAQLIILNQNVPKKWECLLRNAKYKTEGQANSLVFVFLYKYECSAGKREI